MTTCPCDSTLDFKDCCGPYLDATCLPKTALALMRSRYSAYSLENIDYIKATMRGKALVNFNEQEAYEWAKKVRWDKLEILSSTKDKVEFKAYYYMDNQLHILHELSEFKLVKGQWFYIGKAHKSKAKRNQACPCGSRKKFKHCCGRA